MIKIYISIYKKVEITKTHNSITTTKIKVERENVK